MTKDTAIYRQGIRDGSIRCRRSHEGGLCNPALAEHEPGCRWEAAVALIYTLERAAESVERKAVALPAGPKPQPVTAPLRVLAEGAA
jgi:hypothetical protein